MKTFTQYLEAKAQSGKMDEGLMSMLGFGPKLASGQPIPQGWSPDAVKAYNAHYKQAASAGIGGKEAHMMATREAEAHMQTAAKMKGYQAAAAAPMKTLPDPKRPAFGVGNMPAKDTTADVLGHHGV